MRILHFGSLGATALALLIATASEADDEEKRRADGPARSADAEAEASASAAAQGFSAPSPPRIELFVSAGLALVNTRAEDSIRVSAGSEGGSDSVSAARLASEFGWGGGLRLMFGEWGIEGTYNRFDSPALSPSWVIAEEHGSPAGQEDVTDAERASGVTTGLLDLPFAASRASIGIAQLVRTFDLPGGTELFIGAGAGWLEATDSSTDRLLGGVALPPPNAVLGEDFAELASDFLDVLTPELSVAGDRSGLAYGGSIGLSFQVGRILLRPRAEVIVAPALTTQVTIRFPDATEFVGDFEFGYETSVRPTIYLVTVDIGLSS